MSLSPLTCGDVALRLVDMPATLLESSQLDRQCPPYNAVRARLETATHPRAVGTFGPAVAQWGTTRAGLHPRRVHDLRWWQHHTLARAFEHDDEGRLVWGTVLLSAPRQVGKSVLERCVCGWRLDSAEQFGGDPQHILHVANKLLAAQEVWQHAAWWAESQGWAVRWANGEQRITHPDGGRWLVQAATPGAGVSFSLSMALVDEAWAVRRSVVDGAILPTLAEAEQGQMWLVSTAGTSESDLMAGYRAVALSDPEAAGESPVLILEWSAPPDPDLDIDDPEVWRAASPHWDDRRHRAIAQARSMVTDLASEFQFRQQWLNQWVPTASSPLFDERTWREAEWPGLLPSGPVAFGVDIAADRSHAAILSTTAGVLEVVDARDGAAWVPGRVLELAERWAPTAIGVDGTGPAATVIDQLVGTVVENLIVTLNGRQLAAACGELYDALASGRMAARPHVDLDEAVLHARKRVYGQSWTFARQAGEHSGVALLAAAVAAWAATHAPTEPEVSQIW